MLRLPKISGSDITIISIPIMEILIEICSGMFKAIGILLYNCNVLFPLSTKSSTFDFRIYGTNKFALYSKKETFVFLNKYLKNSEQII